MVTIKHSTTKTPGQKVFAVADWNANHSVDVSDIDFWSRTGTTLTTKTPGDELELQNNLKIWKNSYIENYTTRHSNDTFSVGWNLRKSRGTHAIPLPVLNGDILGTLYGQGYNSANYRSGTRIIFKATENFAVGSCGAKIKFQTTPNGTYEEVDTLILEENGDLNISRGDLLMNSVQIIDNNAFVRPVTSTDAGAPNNSIYYSSTASKLVYKNAGGVVNNLY